jgi:hypothetical protein
MTGEKGCGLCAAFVTKGWAKDSKTISENLFLREMQMAEQAIILCPGPCLDDVGVTYINALAKGFDAKVIAVNGAVMKFRRFDWWAVQDWEVYAACMKVLGGTKFVRGLFMPSNWFDHETVWVKDYKKENGEVIPSFSDIPHISFKKHFLKEVVPVDNALPWDRYTMFAAIGLAVMFGAEQIQIYGADLQGQGYFAKDVDNHRTNHSGKRWKNERRLYDRIKQACAQDGIQITRVPQERGI